MLPVYNGEEFLEEAIISVLGQTHTNFKLYIINDGSTDNSKKIAQKFASIDSRVILIDHENMGMGNSLNKVIQITENNWIVRMDADDIMMPDRLEQQIDFINSHPDIAVASTLVYYINSLGIVIGKNKSDLTTIDQVNKLIRLNEPLGFTHPAVIMKKQAVQSVGGYRAQFWPVDDIDLWNRIVEKGYKVLVQPKYLLKYRIHSNSVSISNARKTRLKFHWVKESLLARRSGKKEPDWEEFCQFRKQMPLIDKINIERKDLAKILYKSATFAYAKKKYFLFFASFICSAFLQPSYAFMQAIRKVC